MGRPERPIDPRADVVAEFAAGLRRLRVRAGRPSYRELARQASFSRTVLSEAAGGRALPTLAVTRAYVRACGGDVGEWEARWQRVAAQHSAATADAAGPAARAPYLGLASYQSADADLFFGRDALVRELSQRLNGGRFLAVFGPSGSGKSSLLRAGLRPAVERDGVAGRTVVTALFTPGPEPVMALAAQVASLAGVPAGPVRASLMTEPGRLGAAVVQALAGYPANAELLLIVDQFEEVFTLCDDERQRACFVHALLGATEGARSRARVVVGVRADFYPQCARWPRLVTALRDAQVLVGPLGEDELREVIVKPAAAAGVGAERALVATVIADAGTEPGALPLVSHALLETWRRCQAGRLTLAAYRAAGGLRHAIATTAEDIYAGCDEDGRRILRRIFLRLVALGDGGPDTRRRVAAGELTAAGGDACATAGLVERLAQARLVTADDGSVQLAHEALIRFWPRLAEWLAEDRDGLRVHRRLADAAAVWAGFRREPTALYRGTPLMVARAWAGRDGERVGITPLEQEFLDASAAAHDAALAAAERATRRLRALAAALVTLLLVVTGAGGIAVSQRQAAVHARQAALSRQFAAQSATLAATHPDAAVLAALTAWQTMPTTAARSALLSTAACCTSAHLSLHGETGVVQAAAFSPAGTLMASGGEDTLLHLWNPVTGHQVAALPGHTRAIRAVAFSHRGDLLATGSLDHTIIIWDPARRLARTVLAADTGTVQGLAFSPGDRLLASASYDGDIRLWNPANGKAEQVLRNPGHQMWTVAFSPDAATVAAAGDDDTITLWDISDLAHPRVALRLTGASATIENLAYSPRGDMIASAASDGEVILWNLRHRTRTVLRGLTAWARALAFSADGTTLLTAGAYHGLLLWDTSAGRRLATFTDSVTADIYTLAYSPDGASLALGGWAGYLQVWHRPVPAFAGHTAPVTGLAVTPDGTTIISVSSDNTMRMWDRGGHPRTMTTLSGKLTAVSVSRAGTVASAGYDQAVSVWGPRASAPRLSLRTPTWISDVAFSPDGRLLAASAGGTVTMWATASGERLLTLPSRGGDVSSIAFSPDGAALAAVSDTGAVIVWSTGTGRLKARSAVPGGALNAVAFSPDGRLLATAGDSGRIILWEPGTLSRLAVLTGHTDAIQALAFAPDGTTLASAGNDDAIILWDVPDRTPTATLSGHQGAVNALAFTPDGTVLVSGSDDHRIIAWGLRPGPLVAQACRELARDPDLASAQALVPGASFTRVCRRGSP